MIKFYTNRSGGAIVQKIFIMLNEINIPYTVISIDMHSESELFEELERINPNKKVPAMMDEDTGIVLFESSAILHYLAEKTKMLLPEGLLERNEVMKWLMFEAANISPTMLELIHYEIFATEELPATHIQRYKVNIKSCCAILNEQLKQRDYLCNEYSIADIATYTWHLLLVDLVEINLDDFPNLLRWIKTVSQRPSVIAASTQD